MLRLLLNNSPICIFVQTVLKLMISLKKWPDINHLTNKHIFTHSELWQRLAVQDVLMQNNIAHWLSPSEASWRVLVQYVTLIRLGFLTLEPPLIRRIHSSRLKRLEAEWAGQAELTVCGFDQCLTGQNRSKPGQGRTGWG